MKKLLLSAGIVLSSLFFAQAQQTAAPTADQQSEKMMTTLTSTCHLTPDQVTKAKPIITEFVNAILANRQKFGADKDKLKAANEASKKNRDTKLSAFLTADQQKELTAKESENKAKKAAMPVKTKASDK
jgi:hypothetical protein